MPFRRRRHHPDLAVAEQQRIAVPLARVEERLMGIGSSLDDLASGVSDVALRIREMADHVANQAGGGGDGQ